MVVEPGRGAMKCGRPGLWLVLAALPPLLTLVFAEGRVGGVAGFRGTLEERGLRCMVWSCSKFNSQLIRFILKGEKWSRLNMLLFFSQERDVRLYCDEIVQCEQSNDGAS